MSLKAPRALLPGVCLAVLAALSACDRSKGPTPPKPSTASTETGTPKGILTERSPAADVPAAAHGEGGRGRNVAGATDSGPASAAAATLPGGGLPQPGSAGSAAR
ncbi:hypothetical protein [Ideonella sp. BN130291]|uniref:hypothetical protein n=1 Tax=Ideonella sp. BN130291 TaxID=3112940 RepID=UPI002E2734C0|nr:hypothetical protein [Ideonella sp. BN130291]